MENTHPAGGPAAPAPHGPAAPAPHGPAASGGQSRSGSRQDPPVSAAGRAAPAPRPAPAAGTGPRPRVRLTSPADVLAVVPYLLGFHPARSFAVIGAGPRGQVDLGFRYDLPDPPGPAAAGQIAEHAAAVLARRAASVVIAVGYGPGPLVTPVADAFAATAGRYGLQLRELLRVEDGRYWSYLCREVACCPPEGVAFDTGSHPAAAAMTAAGLAAYPDRATRARAIAPVAGEDAEAMARATRRACARVAALAAQEKRARRGNVLRPVIEEGRRAVAEAIGIYRAGGSITDHGRLAWLTVALANLPVRDDAWARMDPEHRDGHLRLWTDLVRSAAPGWVPAPAALLAFTAWQCGDGALATMAIERALSADPGYSMALLLRDVIDAGVPPSQARVPMTPEEVAESYERQGASPGGRDGGGRGAGGGRPGGGRPGGGRAGGGRAGGGGRPRG